MKSKPARPKKKDPGHTFALKKGDAELIVIGLAMLSSEAASLIKSRRAKRDTRKIHEQAENLLTRLFLFHGLEHVRLTITRATKL